MKTVLLLSLCLPSSFVWAGLLNFNQESEPVSLLTEWSEVPDGFYVNLNEPRLVKFGYDEEPVWITELQKLSAKAQGKQFMDLTDTPTFGTPVEQRVDNVFPIPSHVNDVQHVFRKISTKFPKKILKKLTKFETRYYKSKSGQEAQKWLLSKIEKIKASAPSHLKHLLSVSEFKHKWGQNSIIATIKGHNSKGSVILSAHLDSLNRRYPFGRAPGADDDGSGVVSIFEAYRALINSGFTPENDVEFHWYSAEEVGLLGSQAVVQHYVSTGKSVLGVHHSDMTAWIKEGHPEVIGFLVDNVDDNLKQFLQNLVDEYLDIPWVESSCGYACSDHAPWTTAGYPASVTSEGYFLDAVVNRTIHSENDRIDISREFSFEHIIQFSRLDVAFAIELGGWHKE